MESWDKVRWVSQFFDRRQGFLTNDQEVEERGANGQQNGWGESISGFNFEYHNINSNNSMNDSNNRYVHNKHQESY
mgnify:CR=1 FL=1